MQVTIHYVRPGKGVTHYIEGLVSDDGHCLHTYTVVPEEAQIRLTAALREQALLPEGRQVGAVRKHYFYGEAFNILEFTDTHGDHIAYYSDVATPLVKTETGYTLTDLWLDVWLTPDGALRELDWDEFEAAIQAGLVSPEWQTLARTTLARLVAEAARGIYPQHYLQPHG